MCTDIKTIEERLHGLKKKYFDVEYCLQELSCNTFMVILRGGFKHDNPKAYMEQVAKMVCGDDTDAKFIENHLDCPWVQIIIFNFNKLIFHKDE